MNRQADGQEHKETLFDRWKRWLLNNPIVVALIFVMIVVSVLLQKGKEFADLIDKFQSHEPSDSTIHRQDIVKSEVDSRNSNGLDLNQPMPARPLQLSSATLMVGGHSKSFLPYLKEKCKDSLECNVLASSNEIDSLLPDHQKPLTKNLHVVYFCGEEQKKFSEVMYPAQQYVRIYLYCK